MFSLEHNGLGQRLSMSVAGVTTHYAMNGDYPLSADASGNTTFYLYGLGPIAEKTNAWNYGLPDGTNTQRQLTDANGEITFAARYTPWGDTLETYGTGNFAFGYFGGVMDAATGLLYVGNGQYYDPATGRFLTRDAKPSHSNPYVPLDPTGALFAPLGLLVLFYGRRKKGSKWVVPLLILSLAVVTGLMLSGCGSPTQSKTVVAPTMTYATVTPGATTVYTATPATSLPPTSTPRLTPEALCPPIPPTGVVPPNLGTEADFNTQVSDKKDAFLQAVLRHQNELPYGMSVKLLLAMGAAESGVAYNWDQECLNAIGACPPANPYNDGVLQVTDASGYKGYTSKNGGRSGYGWYNNSATGYDNNVLDAIALLKYIADYIAAGNGREGIERVFGPLPSGDSIKLMLYYNGGNNPIATYRNNDPGYGKGNPRYLSQTAQFLINSPFGCSYNDSRLAADLTEAQETLTYRINHPEEP